MADAAWDKLHDGKGYKIYLAGNGWWDPLRYTVAGPSGRVVTCTVTKWGARRAIRRDMRRKASSPWWQRPLVDEVTPGGER